MHWLNLPTKGSCYERFDDRKISCTSSKLKVALQEEEGKIRHRYGGKLKGCVNATSIVVQSESFPGFSGGWQIVTAVERSQQSRGHFLKKRRTLLWFMNFSGGFLMSLVQVQSGALHGLWKLGANFSAPHAQATWLPWTVSCSFDFSINPMDYMKYVYILYTHVYTHT